MTQELKPCPFCGSKGILEPIFPEKDGTGWSMVRCDNKHCHTDGLTFYNDDHKTSAINWWNTRSYKSCISEELHAQVEYVTRRSLNYIDRIKDEMDHLQLTLLELRDNLNMGVK